MLQAYHREQVKCFKLIIVNKLGERPRRHRSLFLTALGANYRRTGLDPDAQLRIGECIGVHAPSFRLRFRLHKLHAVV